MASRGGGGTLGDGSTTESPHPHAIAPNTNMAARRTARLKHAGIGKTSLVNGKIVRVRGLVQREPNTELDQRDPRPAGDGLAF